MKTAKKILIGILFFLVILGIAMFFEYQELKRPKTSTSKVVLMNLPPPVDSLPDTSRK